MQPSVSGGAIENSLIPIVLGVTGHRDLRPEDVTHLERAVREIFQSIQSKYPSSPIVLLSPLAEGADRLVARMALEIGANLIVPLSMPAAEYERDFVDSVSRTEFAELRGKSTSYFELPLVEGNTPQSISSHGPERDRQYEQVGAYIAQHSQILIALWNGVDDGKVAGTAAVVRFKFQGIPKAYVKPQSTLSQPDNGPVYHIMTPRVSHPDCIGAPFEVVELYPEYWGAEAQARETYDRLLRCVDEYNSDVCENQPNQLQEIARSRGYVIPKGAQPSLAPGLQDILDHYAVSDVLAQKFQKLRFRTIRGLYGLVLVSFLIFQAYIEFWRSPWLLFPYPLLSIWAIAWYLRARRRGYERKHQDYRALAEAMRVEFFWRLAGVGANAADHYLHKHKGELEWIRYAIRAWNINTVGRPHHDRSALELTRARWVLDQANWFGKRAVEITATLRNYHRSSKLLFVASLTLAFLLLALELFGASTHYVFEEVMHSLMIFAIVAPLAGAATIQGYLEKLVLSEQSKQYERMAGIYELAATRLERGIDQLHSPYSREVLFELGKEALAENGDWILLHRARQLDVPMIEANLHI